MRTERVIQDVTVGKEIPPIEQDIGIEQLVRWAGASGDFSPIHYDREYTQGAGGLPDLIVHGPFKLALVVRHLTTWANCDPGAIKAVDLRFASMDTIGMTLRVGATIDRVDLQTGEVWLTVSVGDADRVSTTGTARVVLPRAGGTS